MNTNTLSQASTAIITRSEQHLSILQTNRRSSGSGKKHQNNSAFTFQSPFQNRLLNNQALLLLIIKVLKLLISRLQAAQQPQKEEFRSFDGSKNNKNSTTMGAINSPYINIIPTDSTRDIGGSTEVNLPNPRAISNTVMAQSGNTENKKGLSDMFWLWGQFLDHDITLTPEGKDDRADIAIPTGDRFFDPQGTGTQTMKFERSKESRNEKGEKVYTNVITAYIDGSNIYGSDKETADRLRSFEGGRLTTSANTLMPENDKGHFVSGDVRVNENVGLSAMHTLWMREHNRIADKLAAENPRWNDEKLFQKARKLVIAEMQAISYNEFIPQLLGKNTLDRYKGYNPNVSAQVSNSFATAAYRLGHTMISPTILRLDEKGQEIAEGNLALRDAFFRPDKLKEAGIDPILRGFASQKAQAVDPMLIDDLRNFLFGPPGAGGFDLASLNIQRGRDHALSSFNDSREALGLRRIESFDDPIWKGDFGEKLAQVYDSPDDVDLWVGGLAEKETGDSIVGETFTLIMKDQYERLRDGDRFWYESKGQFSRKELRELNNLKLSDVIKRNTDIENIQDNVMRARVPEVITTAIPEPASINIDPLAAPTVIEPSATNSNIRTLDTEILREVDIPRRRGRRSRR